MVKAKAQNHGKEYHEAQQEYGRLCAKVPVAKRPARVLKGWRKRGDDVVYEERNPDQGLIIPVFDVRTYNRRTGEGHERTPYRAG